MWFSVGETGSGTRQPKQPLPVAFDRIDAENPLTALGNDVEKMELALVQ